MYAHKTRAWPLRKLYEDNNSKMIKSNKYIEEIESLKMFIKVRHYC